MRFDKKFLGRVAKGPAYCNEKIFAEFFCFVGWKNFDVARAFGRLTALK